MKKKITLVILSMMVIYTLFCSFTSLNEHFDTSSPKIKEIHVLDKFIRYQPFKINSVKIQLENKNVRIAILPELYDKLNIGMPLIIVQKAGFLGKTWYQDQEFYNSLASSRIFQGLINIFIIVIMLFFYFHIVQKWFGKKNTYILMFSLCFISLLLFYLVP